MNRRAFLRSLLAGAGGVVASGVLAACRTGERKTPSPTPGLETATPPSGGRSPSAAPLAEATGTPAVPRAAATGAGASGRTGRQVWAWLRMMAVGDIPTSEADYQAHSDQIDTVMPLNGGRLNAAGEWEQEDHKVETDWARRLPPLARSAGQLYMPGMGNDRDGTLTVLASTRLQEQAAASLVELATTKRWDAPWDGVYLDIEGISFDYRSQMTGFLFRIGRAVKDAGLRLGISVGGVTASQTGTTTGDDAIDLGVAAELADVVDLRCYDYGGPPPRSIGPYWWIESCIEYALKKGVKPVQMTGGLATFSQYWPSSDEGQSEQITYDQAQQIIRQADAKASWIEQNANGLVRESFAQVGPGHIWISDGQSYRQGLGLIEKYRLRGNTMFVPGMGTAEQWQEVAAWRK